MLIRWLGLEKTMRTGGRTKTFGNVLSSRVSPVLWPACPGGEQFGLIARYSTQMCRWTEEEDRVCLR